MTEKEAIERLKLCSNNECNICGRYEKEECMLERNRCEKTALKALEQKDKIIDLIVNTMVSDKKILALVCKHIINKTEIECKEQNLLCDDCIKQFFER